MEMEAVAATVADLPFEDGMIPHAIGGSAVLLVDDSNADEEGDSPAMCRICGEQGLSEVTRHAVHSGKVESVSRQQRLIRPCACKGSASYIHPACLEEWIIARPSARPTPEGSDSEARSGHMGSMAIFLTLVTNRLTSHPSVVCEICKCPYRITLSSKFRFSWTRCCGARSVGHLCELALLLCGVMIAVFFTAESALLPSQGLWMYKSGNMKCGGGSSKAAHRRPFYVFGSDADTVLVPLLCLALLVMCVMAVIAVVCRWVQANSMVRIVGGADCEAAVMQSDGFVNNDMGECEPFAHHRR